MIQKGKNKIKGIIPYVQNVLLYVQINKKSPFIFIYIKYLSLLYNRI